MTSEVVLMNRQAVAMAADSAVTISGDRYLKTYQSVDKLVPLADLPNHGFRPPASTFGDTFTDTNGTALESHTPTGPDAGSGWSLHTGGAGAIDIVSNRAESQTNEVIRYFLDDNLSSDDHWAEAEVGHVGSGATSFHGLIVRKVSGATLTNYLSVVRHNGTNFNRIRLYRSNAGTPTQLGGTDNSPTLTNGSVMRFEVTDSDVLTLYDDGVADHSATDGSPITGNTLVGVELVTSGGGVHLYTEDFLASDLPTTGGNPHSQAVIVS